MRNIYLTVVLIWELFLFFDMVFLVDVLSDNAHLRSSMNHAHHTHLTHAQTYVNGNATTWIEPLKVNIGRFLFGELLRDGLENTCRKVNNFSKVYRIS